MRLAARCLCAVGLWLASLALAAPAEERILSFHADVAVRETGVLDVRETITVTAEGVEIKRGIYRDFPTQYPLPSGLRRTVEFNVVSVTRDGEPEPYRTEAIANGVRVYAGRADYLLPIGTYTYVFAYEATRQVGFFADHDELYWNVTGNDWAFPIAVATCRVVLPAAARGRVGKLEAYTGPAGTRGADFTAGLDAEGWPWFQTTRPLGPREGLTIVVPWPKGIVAALTPAEQRRALLRDNVALAAGVAGVAAVLLYYLLAWVLVGRDPARGTIIPLFHPPENMSPALLRYIARMGYDQRTFSVALVSLASKGAVTLEESGRGVYTVVSGGGGTRPDPLADEEFVLLRELLLGQGRITLESGEAHRISTTYKAVRREVRARASARYFKTHRAWAILGLILSFVVLVSVIAGNPGEGLPMLITALWGGGFGVAVLAILGQARSAWRAWRRQRGCATLIAAVIAGFVGACFLAVCLAGTGAMLAQISRLFLGLLAALFLVNVLFLYLLKAPTLAGRKLMDQIEGFKMYLGLAEKERLEVLHPPEKTPELFERYLPYAMALDVENRWAEQFADVLAAAGHKDGSYRPAWYAGTAWSVAEIGHVASALGSGLTSAVAAASSPPGSSSGGGGGGSSGGGGGGGGGGGW